ncbi:MAG: hypothetical protein O6949_13355 [Chloroflexi bacterium]|nr:hypothetical protein [Chloroflexota bacterium]
MPRARSSIDVHVEERDPVGRRDDIEVENPHLEMDGDSDSERQHLQDFTHRGAAWGVGHVEVQGERRTLSNLTRKNRSRVKETTESDWPRHEQFQSTPGLNIRPDVKLYVVE